MPKTLSSRQPFFAPCVYKAAGASREALDRFYEKESQALAHVQIFQTKILGSDDTQDLRAYGDRPEAEWNDCGIFMGFRFDWLPLNVRSTIKFDIGSYPVPAGWVAVTGHSGVYRPDDRIHPALAKMCQKMNRPDIRTVQEVCGKKPATIVHHAKGTYPRAYYMWPMIHAYKDSYLVEAVIDYRGKHFVPIDAESVPLIEWQQFCSMLGIFHEGEWTAEQGAPLPADYVEDKKITNASDGRRYFLLRGTSHEIYKAFEREGRDASRERERLIHTLWNAQKVISTDKGLAYAEFDHHPGPGWIPLYNQPGAWRLDLSTEEGRRKKEVFDNLPQNPDLLELQMRLLGEDMKQDLQLLIFPSPFASHRDSVIIALKENHKGKSVPDGALEIPRAIYHWHKGNHNDQRGGIACPGVPTDALEDFAAFNRLLNPPAPPMKPKPPQP